MKKIADLPRVDWASLTNLEQQAVVAARKVREKAYAPYLNYKVGVAIVSVGEIIYTGVSVENAHKVGHAEEYALGEMAKNGERQFTTLVCHAKNGGIPCMSCRQCMREFSGEDLDRVIIIGSAINGDLIKCKFSDIVGVDSFGPADLGIDPTKF